MKADGTWRIAGDYRRVNAITVPDRYPTPHLHDCATNLSARTIFSSLDLHRAYNQIPMAPDDVPKTAVITPFGLFEFMYMTYGLRNASQTFQRYVDRILGDLDGCILLGGGTCRTSKNYFRKIKISPAWIKSKQVHVRGSRNRVFGLFNKLKGH